MSGGAPAATAPSTPASTSGQAAAKAAGKPAGKKAQAVPLRYRLGVASRAVAAIGGGYGLTALCSAALALWLPGPRAEAALTATMASFALYATAVVWVFSTRSAGRAWAGLLLASALAGAAWWVHRFWGGA